MPRWQCTAGTAPGHTSRGWAHVSAARCKCLSSSAQMWPGRRSTPAEVTFSGSAWCSTRGSRSARTAGRPIGETQQLQPRSSAAAFAQPPVQLWQCAHARRGRSPVQVALLIGERHHFVDALLGTTRGSAAVQVRAARWGRHVRAGEGVDRQGYPILTNTSAGHALGHG